MRTRLISGIVLATTMVFAACSSGETPAPASEFDRAALERTEDLTESLANDLLALSVAVRDGDSETVARHFAGTVEATPVGLGRPESHALGTWVEERHWTVSDQSRSWTRDQFIEEFGKLTAGFSSLEDTRFKVVESRIDVESKTGEPTLKFFIVGRDLEGQREWLKGRIAASVRKLPGEDDEGPWQIERFRLTEVHGKRSSTDLFSEVAYPAGVAARFPAFGEGKNEGFVYHGVATADINLDGLLDVATTGVDSNRLYLSRGDGTFEDVSSSSLVGLAPVGSGAMFLDHDNDGDADLFFASVGRQILFENRFIPDGDVRFWDISEKAGVDHDAVGFSPVAADVNGDGYVDIYVAAYNRYGTVMPDSWIQAANGTPNLLLLNQGDGTFREVAGEWGVADDRWSYAAGFIDLDEDGDQDLYVANDFGENGMYRNEGDHFEEVAEEMGIVDRGFGMGVSFGDFDNDGDFDLHVTNMSSTAGNRILKLLYPEGHQIRTTLSKQAAGNSLYRNNGDGSFDDVTAELGGLSGGWSFGGGFVDFDNDGREDIYAPNGFVSGKTMKDT